MVIPTQPLPPKVQAAVEVGPGPTALTAGFGSVWVAAHHGAEVQRVDPSTNRVIDNIAVGTEPGALVAGQGHVWVSDFGDGFGWRIDPRTDKATRFQVVAGSSCGWLAVGAGSVWISGAKCHRKVYAANSGSSGDNTQDTVYQSEPGR